MTVKDKMIDEFIEHIFLSLNWFIKRANEIVDLPVQGEIERVNRVLLRVEKLRKVIEVLLECKNKLQEIQKGGENEV